MVVHEDPADRHEPLARLIPMATSGDDSDVAGPTPIPADRQATTPPGGGDHLPRLGLPRPLDARPTHAAVRRRRLEKIGFGVQLADQPESVAVPVHKAGDLVGAVTAVAHKEETSAGRAAQQHPQQPAHQLGWGPMRPVATAVVLLRTVQIDQHGQRPGPVGEREPDQNRQDDPAVAVAPGCVGMG
jgi:hypothetical protein